ncbi:hypothetical protein J7T55_013964 [Diaporthe amygdali]|uniref:uncharacterized protein n=1 Tax=Phomopsis amygdali TaxID=1214568 RepID=UPI0022FDD056|nr:uncharacterized protein J7T55_013964 [Diaporthe amygdali]KAJ0119760.1 hypothetical protein J7T55_013964 [Diaporthe amygdali]
MSKPFVAVAGATGQLGRVIATNLRQRNVSVKAIVRPGTAPSRTEALRNAGVIVAEADLSDVAALTKNMQGATCVVSALNGLQDTMHGTQGALLDAAVAAHVPRFIPSDFSLDFTKTAPGSNRNLDLRREFHTRLNESGIQWTSVLNGGFMDLLGGQAPLINDSFKRVLYWNSDEQKLDFTTVADTAAYTAAVAADPNPTPRFLRIAGDTFTAKELAEIVTRVRGATYSTMWVGSAGFLEGASSFMRRFSIGGGEQAVFPAWQGMQYMANMFSGDGKLDPLDNDRYPGLKWTKAEEFLAQQQAS